MGSDIACHVYHHFNIYYYNKQRRVDYLLINT